MKEAGGLVSRFYRSVTEGGVLHGQDPYVARRPDTGTFVLFQSHNNRKLTVREFEVIEDVKRVREVTIWKPPRGSEYHHGLWAPEGHIFPNTPWEGKWYVPVALSTGDSETEEMFVLESKDSNPRSPYEVKSRLHPGHWGIDQTYMMDGGQLYAIWSGREKNDQPFPQNIYIAPMENPWTLIPKEAKKISTPEYAWEFAATGEAVNEGPQVREKDGKKQIIVSGSGSWTTGYVMGVLDQVGDDVLNPLSWRKRPAPIYRRNRGHGHTVDLGNGREIIIAGRKLYDEPGWEREILWDDVSATTLDQLPQFATVAEVAVFTPPAHREAGFASQVA